MSEFDDHLSQHGHMWVPLESNIQADYLALEHELRGSTNDTDTTSVLDGVDTTKMDAKTLARLKNRDQAKKSREKKKRAIEGMSDELSQARKKLSDQADFLARAQEKLKQYEEMVETNRKLAEENLRLQAILFPDPDDPLSMAVPGSISSSVLNNKCTTDSGVQLQLAHEFIDCIQDGVGWDDGVDALVLDEDSPFRCDTMPKCETVKQFAECMVKSVTEVFDHFAYIRKSATCDGDEVCVVCMCEGEHVANGPVAPQVPPKRMSSMAVFSVKFTDTKHEGRKIESVDLIFDTHTAYCQLGWPLVCFLKPKSNSINAGMALSGTGFKMVREEKRDVKKPRIE
jgi:hypothetical protein